MEIEKLKKEIKDSWLDMENLFVSGFDLFSKDGKSFTLKSHKLDDILKEDNLEKLIAFKNRIEIHKIGFISCFKSCTNFLDWDLITLFPILPNC